MQIKLDSIDNPRKLLVEAETKNNAYDLGAIRTVLATHGVVFEMLPAAGDSVVLAIPLSWPCVSEESESAD